MTPAARGLLVSSSACKSVSHSFDRSVNQSASQLVAWVHGCLDNRLVVRFSLPTYNYHQVQDSDESSADKSGKPFTAAPNSSNFFVMVGRNVDQWRASLGLEEGINLKKCDNTVSNTQYITPFAIINYFVCHAMFLASWHNVCDITESEVKQRTTISLQVKFNTKQYDRLSEILSFALYVL